MLTLIVIVAGLLVGGYVLLAATGRDTTGYILLIGGPAMTSIIGTVLAHRVRAVAVAVGDVQAATAAVIDDELPAVHRHLEVQDQALGTLVVAISGAVDEPTPPAPAPAGGSRLLPFPRPNSAAEDDSRRPE